MNFQTEQTTIACIQIQKYQNAASIYPMPISHNSSPQM